MIAEQELVRQAKQGDTGAFEALMQKNQGKIYNLGLRLLRNKDDAADLLQETFIKAYESLPKFRGEAAFSTWLYRIAMNFALMKMRRDRNRKVSLDELKDVAGHSYSRHVSDWSGNPHVYLKNRELKSVLDGVIASLPPKYRSVFVLHDVEGLSLAKVAKILSLSIPAVKSRVHRSRMYLRERLDEHFKTMKACNEL